jgi:hypothetical protein
VSAVEGASHDPEAMPSGDDAPDAGTTRAAATPAPTLTRTPTSTPTPREGIALIAADEGRENAAQSERTNAARSGGGMRALWMFGAVAAALATLGGFAVYQKRRVS